MSSLRALASIAFCAAVIVGASTLAAASGHEAPPSMAPEAMAEMAAWMDKGDGENKSTVIHWKRK